MKQQLEQTIETFLKAKEMHHGIPRSPIYIESSNVHYDKTMISDLTKKEEPEPEREDSREKIR